jgi:hypothetical protein
MSSRLTLVRRFLIIIDRLRLGFGFTVTASNLNSCCLSSGSAIGLCERFEARSGLRAKATEISVRSPLHSGDYRILRLKESSILSPYDHVGMHSLSRFPRNSPGHDDPCRSARLAAHATSPNNKPAYDRGRSRGRRRRVNLGAYDAIPSGILRAIWCRIGPPTISSAGTFRLLWGTPADEAPRSDLKWRSNPDPRQLPATDARRRQLFRRNRAAQFGLAWRN